MIAGTEQLDEVLREKNVEYIEEFFEIIEDPSAINELIIKRCRGVDLMNKYFGEPVTSLTSDR